jgi:hypothetical protein
VRAEVERFSRELFITAEDRGQKRAADLDPINGGYPMSLEPLSMRAFYEKARAEAWIELSGTFSGRTAVGLSPGDVTVSIGGSSQNATLECLPNGTRVDIVFLVDITAA